MPRQPRVGRADDLIDGGVTHQAVYDLAPGWRVPRPDVAGLRTHNDVERLRTLLMAGHPFRSDPRAPRVLTDRGQRVVERAGFAEPSIRLASVVLANGLGIAAAAGLPLLVLGMMISVSTAAAIALLALFVAYPIVVTVEDELENPRLSDAVELTGATSAAIRATVQEAAADLQLLRGVSSPSLPKLG